MKQPRNIARNAPPRATHGAPAFTVFLMLLCGCPIIPGSGSSNANAPPGNFAPTILSFDVTPASVNVGEPVTIAWRVLDLGGGTPSAAISVDREQRADYEIVDAVATTTQQHTFRSAGTFPVLIRVSDGYASSDKVVSVEVAGPIAVEVSAPYGGQTVTGGSVHICASIRSAFDIATVAAELPDRSAPLLTTGHSAGVFTYCGDIDLTEVASGPQLLAIHVRDVKDNDAQALRGFVIDRAPTTQVLEPLAESVVGDAVRVHLLCADVDSGACTAHAILKSNLIATDVDLGDFGDELDKTVDVAALAGRTVFVQTTGTGLRSTAAPYFHVEPSTRLRIALQADGRIFDADATRLLVALKPLGDRVLQPVDTWSGLAIVDRATGGQTGVPLPDGARFAAGGARLLDGGVAFRVTTESDSTPTLYWWAGAAPLALFHGHENRINGAGHFLTWSDGNAVRRFDATTGDTSDVATNAFSDLSVDALGTVVFIERGTYAVKRHRAGVTTTLYQNDAKFTGPARIDGEHTLLSEFDRVGSTNQRLLLIDATANVTEVATATADSPIGGGYAINAGWIAFRRPSASGVAQVWRRSPGGNLEQVTFFGDPCSIEGIDAEGGLMLIRGGPRDGKRLFGGVGKELLDVSYAHGDPKLFDGKWNLMLGRVLFEVAAD